MPKKSKTKQKEKLPALLKSCEELFETTNLYEVLGIRRQATPQEVKKGYHKVSLTVHPDRVGAEEKEVATRKFQTLGKVYSILSDKDKRAVYDETGEVGEEDDVIDQDRDWCEYWRLLFPKVTVKDIEEFEKKYKGSEEEVSDLKTAYLEAEGDMDVIMDSVLCSCPDDEQRFTGILTSLIHQGELPSFNAFTKESKRKRTARRNRATQEAAEAEEEAKRLKLDDSPSSLTSLIHHRHASRAAHADSFFASLEAKYCQPHKGKKKKK
ncbi:dnaJ homolog subfamily C member 9-like [Babylonia areolata]|uniref:dnaJ homolog subfamily C member 9-like n=1 Tax=Babylonia areolata TaxID=304850 RepID=UPI003FD09B98